MKKYEGFSLVEMIITIAIIGVVMLISSSTLTTLIKISTVSSSKTMVRNETEFVLELIRRTVRNSDPSEVYVFNSYDPDNGLTPRLYNPSSGLIENEDDATAGWDDIYGSSLEPNTEGNEIHFRPYGFTNWVCIGYFPSTTDSEFGYILKTSGQDLWDNHKSCFDIEDNSKYTIVLNSDSVDIDDFNISYIQSSDGNYVFKFDIEAKPTEWYLGNHELVNRSVFRQAVVTTGGLIW